MQLPGAPGNILLSFLATLKFGPQIDFYIHPSETYLRYIINFPPEALGLARIATPYENINVHVKLIGGEYVLVEPFMNFGVWSLLIFLPIIVLLFNICLSAIKSITENDQMVIPFLFGSTFVAMIFRTFWYGGGATYRTFTIVLLAAPILFILLKSIQGLDRRKKRWAHAVR